MNRTVFRGGRVFDGSAAVTRRVTAGYHECYLVAGEL